MTMMLSFGENQLYLVLLLVAHLQMTFVNAFHSPIHVDRRTSFKVFAGRFHHNDLPSSQYRDALDEYQIALTKASEAVSRLESLSKVMSSIETLDPDITKNEDGSTRLTALEAAIDTALRTSESTGRTSFETEFAWCKVDEINRQSVSPHALLAHPSFRYNYGYYLVQRAKRQSSGTQNQLQYRTQKTRDDLKGLQNALFDLQSRLDEQTRAKKEIVSRLRRDFGR